MFFKGDENFVPYSLEKAFRRLYGTKEYELFKAKQSEINRKRLDKLEELKRRRKDVLC